MFDQVPSQSAFFAPATVLALSPRPSSYLPQALQIAQSSKDSVGSDLARCNVGLVQGNLEFEQYISSIQGGEDSRE